MIRTQQYQWVSGEGWLAGAPRDAENAEVAFVFGTRTVLSDPACLEALEKALPGVTLFGCSTAGEIIGTAVFDETVSVTVLHFENTKVRLARATVAASSDTRMSARVLARELQGDDLLSVLVVSDGLNVYGPELIQGLADELPAGVVITGGLAADGTKFCDTAVLSKFGVEQRTILALGFYGSRLKVGQGSLGGWDPFGPHRRITRASRNVLHELDGKSALGLYKRYLGEHADALPSAGLLFPLCVRRSRDDAGVVRTVLSVDEDHQTMTFAGDVPEGGYAQLMRANVDRLVDGALGAARATLHAGASEPAFALVISCSGRRMVLRQRVEEELEAVREVLGQQTMMTGFYSYGEIAPSLQGGPCEFHNQTMTLMTLTEA